MVVVWYSSSTLVSTNEVNLRRARLVLGWVTVSGFSLPVHLALSLHSSNEPGELSQ